MKWVITGGAGFVGSNIAEALVAQNEEVVIVDNFSSGTLGNLRDIKNKITLFKGSITDPKIMAKACKHADYLLHQAAIASVPKSVEDPIGCERVNVEGTLHVLSAARDAGVKKVVMASSSAVYGDNPEMPKTEQSPIKALSPYGFSKIASEEYCRLFYELYGLNYCALRYFNIFGPKQDPKGAYAAVIPQFITTMLQGKQPVIFGDGKQTRDFVYIANVVNANLLAAKSTKTGIYNIGSGATISLNQLVAGVNAALGKKIQPNYAEERKGDIKHSSASIDKAKKELIYSCSTTFQDGLRKTIEWYRKKQ